jgi:type II secretory pathway pseudopilin PulG
MKRVVLLKGFSLIELLLAIFILAIGIISIAALFPAGISQQQKAADEVVGNIVSQNALSIIRSRVEQEDFGHASHFDKRWSAYLCNPGISIGEINPWPTVCGDWMWRRPGIFRDDVDDLQMRGAIDIFATPTGDTLTEYWTNYVTAYDDSAVLMPGIPYNRLRYPAIDTTVPPDGINDLAGTPRKVIFASERQYPMWSGAADERPKAQYYWDCMFRRYQGRVLVAIFVYRVVEPEGYSAYTVDTNGMTSPGLPARVNLQTQSLTGSWPNVDDYSINISLQELAETENDDPTDWNNQWQFPGQWIVDQNGSVHHVKRGRRRSSDSNVVLTSKPLEVFAEATPGGKVKGVNWWDDNYSISDVQNFGYGVVTDIWFVPTSDSYGRTLIPVYATVQEL